jgi:PIN domain nuclease of toxin-antitoxin system
MGRVALVKLLLDTHIWLWALLEPERLSPHVRALLGARENELWLSPISVWEAHLLAERGRIRINTTPVEWVAAMVQALPRREAVLTHDIAVASRELTLAHEDPADRFLAATAKVMGLTLVTADTRLTDTDQYAVLAN